MRAHSNNKNSNDNDNDNNKTSYDKTTGLVFAETVARRRRGTKALIDRCRGRVPTEPGEPRWREAAAAAAAVSSSFSSSSSSARVDTLQDMALRVILRNLDRFDVDSLAWMPEIVLLRIWKKIKARWVLFVCFFFFSYRSSSLFFAPALCRSVAQVTCLSGDMNPRVLMLHCLRSFGKNICDVSVGMVSTSSYIYIRICSSLMFSRRRTSIMRTPTSQLTEA